MFAILSEEITTQSRKMILAGHTVEVCRVMKKGTNKIMYYRFKRLDAENSANININGDLFDCGAFFVPVPDGKITPAEFSGYFEDYLIESMYIAYCAGSNIIKLPLMTFDSTT